MVADGCDATRFVHLGLDSALCGVLLPQLVSAPSQLCLHAWPDPHPSQISAFLSSWKQPLTLEG